MLVVVPNYLRDEINRRLDAEIAKEPAAEKDREALYLQLLTYFNEYGMIPDFTITPTEESPAHGD